MTTLLVKKIIVLAAAHFFGDFPFRNEFLALNKGKSWEINFYHAAVYTSTFVLFGTGLSPLALLIILVSHFIIDPLKCRWGFIKHVWVDQLLHAAVLGLLVLLGI